MTRQIYKKFSNFKNTVDVNTSKVEYKHFLDRMVQEKPTYDFNMDHTLRQKRKIIEYKNKELA